MTCRYIEPQELKRLFDKKILSDDIRLKYTVGVSEVCDLSLLIESKKIDGIHEDTLRENFSNITNEVENGLIWVLELDANNLYRMLSDDGFYEDFCDKKENPYKLSKRISLSYDNSYSYWTENVYIEAFQL
ncbi:MAG: hypothetical protein ABI921_00070 [Panacibacter sp.]